MIDTGYSAEVQQRSINFKELEGITKEYDPLKLRRDTIKKYKIKYNNPDDDNKTISVSSCEDPIVVITTPTLRIPYKEFAYIRMTLRMPETPGFYDSYIIVKDLKDNKIEEVLKLSFDVLKEGEI